MPPVIVVAFYIWLIIGIGLFIYRRATGVPFRSRDKPAENHTMLANSLSPSSPRPATSQFQSPTDTVGDSPVLGVPIQTTVGDLVEGIALPCGLVPYLGELIDGRSVSDRVVFSTTTSGMDSVIQEMQSELMRLGFAVARPRDDRLVATSDGGELNVRVTPPPPGGAHTSYPDVTPGAVVVEMTTG